jgi:hypothetical protein
MLRYLRQNTIAFIALILSVFTLGGATAYAVNTVRSSDIVDGQVMNQDLAPNSVGNGKIIDGQVTNPDLANNSVTGPKLANNSVGSAKVADNSITGSDIDESTLGKVPNAGALNGFTPDVFRPFSRTATVTPNACLTVTQTWIACAPVSVTVPAGHLYVATVLSTMDAKFGNIFADVLLCAAYEGPQCVTGSPDYVSFQPNSYTSTATNATVFLSEGTHSINTAVKVPFIPLADSATHITTTVIMHDYNAEFLG